MKVQDIQVGKKVKYHPDLGSKRFEDAIITSGPYEICGSICCKIDIRSSVVDIENLEEQ